jgi:NAD(P)-dependent dehydrogenase (short-subunit alcohol dehydrogenase family)
VTVPGDWTPDCFSLADRIAIVTGATRGLGRAVAAGFAASGAHVVVTGRDVDRCEQAAHQLASSGGGNVSGMACHMARTDDLRELVTRVLDRFGRIDVLVNNAAINPMHAELVDITEEYLDKVLAVNVRGPVLLSAMCAAAMREAGGGAVVNILSVASMIGGVGSGAYIASKGALASLTTVMAQEWAPWGVRVNAVTPGPFATPMMDGAEGNRPGVIEDWADATLVGRLGHPREVVGAVVYLASDASSFVTGETIAVTGGVTSSHPVDRSRPVRRR